MKSASLALEGRGNVELELSDYEDWVVGSATLVVMR